MATKAQQFKSQSERTHREPEGKKPLRHKRVASKDAGARNLKGAGTSKATVNTEESLSGKPSRKSSRGSAAHHKNSTVLEYASRMRSQTPQRRHQTRS